MERTKSMIINLDRFISTKKLKLAQGNNLQFNCGKKPTALVCWIAGQCRS